MQGRPTTLAYSREGACCACRRCGTGGLFFFFVFFFFFFFFFVLFISSILSSFSDASSLGRRLDILKYCGLGRYNPTVVVSYYRRRARQVLINRLVGLSLPMNSVNSNWPARHDLSCCLGRKTSTQTNKTKLPYFLFYEFLTP